MGGVEDLRTGREHLSPCRVGGCEERWSENLQEASAEDYRWIMDADRG